MKNSDQFNWAIDVLAGAYFEGTLEKRNYCACAVGNLILDVYGEQCGWHMCVIDYRSNGACNETIGMKETGYTIDQIERIERAFEGGQDEFDGLMNVVDVLCEIHDVEDIEPHKAKFEVA